MHCVSKAETSNVPGYNIWPNDIPQEMDLEEQLVFLWVETQVGFCISETGSGPFGQKMKHFSQNPSVPC